MWKYYRFNLKKIVHSHSHAQNALSPLMCTHSGSRGHRSLCWW